MKIGDFIGLGLRPNHYREWQSADKNLWVEVMSDNYISQGGGRGRYNLRQTIRNRNAVMHGVGLNIAGTAPLDTRYIDGLAELADIVSPKVISDHLCFTRSNSKSTYDLLPFPYTAENLHWVSHRINTVQRELGYRLSFENLSRYIRFKDDQMSELEFLAALCRSTGCGIVLDVNNVIVSSYNLKTRPEDELSAVEGWMVTQYHVAGHTNHGSWMHDTHDTPVSENCWSLLEVCLQQFGLKPVILENDNPQSSLVSLIDEIETGTKNLNLNVYAPQIPLKLETLQTQFVEAVYTPPWKDIQTQKLYVEIQEHKQVEVYRNCFYTRITQTLSDTLLAPLAEKFGSDRVQAWLANYAVESGFQGILLQDNLHGFSEYLLSKNLNEEYPELSTLLELCIARWTVLTCPDKECVPPVAQTSLNQITINPTTVFVPRFEPSQTMIFENPKNHEVKSSLGHILFRTHERDLQHVLVPEQCSEIAAHLSKGASLEHALEACGPHHDVSNEQCVQDWLTSLFRLGGLTTKSLGLFVFSLFLSMQASAATWKDQTRRLLQVSSSVVDDVPAGILKTSSGKLAVDLTASATLIPKINPKVGTKNEGIPNAPLHLNPTLGVVLTPFSRETLKTTVSLRGWVGWLPDNLSKTILPDNYSFAQHKFGLEIQIADTEEILDETIQWSARIYQQTGQSIFKGRFSSSDRTEFTDQFHSNNKHTGLSISGTHKLSHIFAETLFFLRQAKTEFFIAEDKNLLSVEEDASNLNEQLSKGMYGSQWTLGWHASPNLQVGAAQLIIPERLSAPRLFLRYQSTVFK